MCLAIRPVGEGVGTDGCGTDIQSKCMIDKWTVESALTTLNFPAGAPMSK
jgi:hypothetical protein